MAPRVAAQPARTCCRCLVYRPLDAPPASTGSGPSSPASCSASSDWRDPGGVHLGVAAARGHQLVVGADLDDPAVVDHHDAVGPHGRRQPVGDEHGRAVLEQDVEGGLDLRLRLEVEVGGGLVEHQHPGMGQEGPGQGDELALPGRQRLAPFVDDGVEAVRASGRPASVSPTLSTASWISSSVASGRAKAMLSPMVPAKRNGSWGTTPSWRRSERMVTSRRSWPSISTLPAGGVVEPGDQLGQGRLAGPGRADEGHRLARGDAEVHVLDHRAGRVVAEGHVVEDDLSVDRGQLDGVGRLP